MTRSTGNPASHQTTPRLFIAGALSQGADVVASAEQAHYLGTVLRRTSGDMVRLFNGADGEWSARVTVPRRGLMSLTVETQLRGQQPESGPWLVFALLKRDATDLVIRQAVELGATRILPVITERTNAARVNEERLRAIAIEAAEQSERLTVPVVEPLAHFDAVLAAWPGERRLFAALERSWPTAHEPDSRTQTCHVVDEAANPRRRDPENDGSFRPDDRTRSPGRDGTAMALLVGPEGGFTSTERELLRRFDFITPISLGPFVLRAETAAAAGQALLLRMGWADYVPSN
jgi:16S rRNA (uracil1498-N3)-methyltransferase